MQKRIEDRQRGYTTESLKTEEGQLNAVFACFGSAVQHSQLFEQGLSRFLTMYNKIASDSVSIDDLGKKMTMGQLLKKVRQRVTINENSVEEGFLTVLDQRNYLVHRFFLERNSRLESTEGRMELLSELVGIERNLEGCRVIINAMRIAMCKALDIKDDWAQDYS